MSRAISDFSHLVWEKTPLFALAGISAALTMSAQRADANKAWYPFGLRVEYALVSYVDYMGKALWPARLSPFYPHPDYVPLQQAALATLVLALVTAVTIANRRRRPYLLVGWLFFLGTLVPMLGLEGVGYQGKQGIADRYAYLPFIGTLHHDLLGQLPNGRSRSISQLPCCAPSVLPYCLRWEWLLIASSAIGATM